MSPAPRDFRAGWRLRGALALAVVLTALMWAGLPSSRAEPLDGVARASVSSAGAEANGGALFQPDITAGGRVVAFTSDASNLVPGDTNETTDVFVHDRVTGFTERVSVRNDGSESTGRSTYASITPDGRFVAFHSFGQLDPADTNPYVDVYVRDRVLRTTRLVSVTVDGGPPTKHGTDDPHSVEADITPDGRFVTFRSAAANLVAGDTNAVQDVFVRDMLLGVTTRVSVRADGLAGLLDSIGQANGDNFEPAISADGRYVVFHTGASNLVDGDNNGAIADVMVHDRLTFTTRRISRDAFGNGGNASSAHAQMTPDGRVIVYESLATNLDGGGSGWDVFLHDTASGTTELVSRGASGGPANGDSEFPRVTEDGVQVVYESTATNLVSGDGSDTTDDVFLYDRKSGATTKISRGLGATADNGTPRLGFTAVSADGRAVAFHSDFPLVESDTNGVSDVYVWDLVAVPELTPPTVPLPTLPPPPTIPPLPPNPVDPVVDCVDEPFDTTLREFTECLTPATLPG